MRPGWRSLIGSALAAPASLPRLWLLGTLGFALRGGVIVLWLPIVVLPTQVEVRLALGTNLGSSGLTSGFWVLVGALTLAMAAIALGILYGLARIEMACFDRLMGDAEFAADIDPGADSLAAPATRPGRHGLMSRLFMVQALTLIMVLLAAVPLAAAVGQATLDEILRPSSSASIYLRVLGHLGLALAVFFGALPAIDTLSALATRRVLLGGSLGAAIGGSLVAVVRTPVKTIASALLAWAALLGVLLGVGWALSIAWQAARAAFLSTTSVSDMLGDPAPFIVALMLAAVFVAGLALAGFVAAFRAALWTVASVSR